MKAKHVWLALPWILPLSLAAQAPNVVPLSAEPHHHLVLQNEYMNVFNAEAAPGDSIRLHRHDYDTIAVAIGDQTVTVSFPAKPDVRSKNPDGQVRLQAASYVHSTRVEGDAPYHTVAIELLRPQHGAHNLCAPVMAGQPLDCPPLAARGGSNEPEFQTDQTEVLLTRIPPRRSVTLGESNRQGLVVALDPVLISPASGEGPDQGLRPGDVVWIGQGGAARAFKNSADKDARLIGIWVNP